jgi:WD40 repeat protein/S1-C subfamily serine protease/tRNA A-37 threonylcarbamoyl transferase component Bud32
MLHATFFGLPGQEKINVKGGRQEQQTEAADQRATWPNARTKVSRRHRAFACVSWLLRQVVLGAKENPVDTRLAIRLLAVLSSISLTSEGRAADEPLTRVQIARIGKAATALVEVKAARGQGHASAFCIHPDGWFVTNAHVAQGEMTLVLNPSLKTEKTYPARVVRSDSELDLALLHIEGAKDLPALALGSDERLEEQMDAMAFGFPLVESSARGRQGYPSISVNAGSITALRREDNRLKEIQLDAELNPGNSGGPVLDNRGKVIGVVRSGVVARGLGRTGMNQAIPVSTVARFLARPEVQFSPPRLGSAALHKPVMFEAQVTALLPSSAPLNVELILKAGNGPDRTIRMEVEGDRYRVTAVPIPGRSGPVTLRLTARFEDGNLEATTTDRTFRVGGREVALADVRTIWPGPPAQVSLRDGTAITGALSGLDAVPVPVGPKTLSVRLDRAKEVNVSPAGQVERVTRTLVVRHGEKEIYRQSEGLTTPDSVKLVEVALLRGHTQPIDGLAVSQDGRRLLSGSADRSLILWDRETAQPIRRLKHPTGEAEAVAFSPDGRRALSGGADMVVRLWDLERGDVIREFRGHIEWVFSVAFSSDGRHAYSTSGGFNDGAWRDGTDSAIRVWDVETGREVRRLDGHRGIVWTVAVSPDGRRLLSAGADSQVILWDAQTGARVRGYRGHTAAVRCAAFLPDGQRAVSCSSDRTIRLWEAETGAEVGVLHGHTQGADWVGVSPDGRWLLSADYQVPELWLWDLQNGKTIQRIKWGNVSPNRGCFTPDGGYAAWTGSDGVVRLYRLTAEDTPASSLSSASQPANGTRLAAGGDGRAQSNDGRPASPPRLALYATAIIAVLLLIILLFAFRRQWWGRLAPRMKRLATGAWDATVHPDATILSLFAAGRLRSSEMERVGDHLAACAVCLEVIQQLPEDPLVGMLREQGGLGDESPEQPGDGKHRDKERGGGSGVAPCSAEDQGDTGGTRAWEPVEDVDEQRWSPGPMGHPRYKLKTLLGHGGMGLIYLADDWEENRAVVLKFLREDLLDRPRMVERFRREAAAATLLKHRNIVEAYGVEPFGRWPALVMEYVQGMDLARLIAKAGPVPVRVGCELIRQAATGLQYSFERGMVHRDIKPSNLIVSNAGTVKILDFGLAKMQSELSVDAGLTSTGALLGSVDYMAPEQLDDPRVADIRADIYSLGCTLYHLLSGAPPFHGTTLEVLEAHRSKQATPLNAVRPEVPSELAAVVARMMAKEPGRRFQSPVAVARALTPFPEGLALERTLAENAEAAIETEVQISGEIRVE